MNKLINGVYLSLALCLVLSRCTNVNDSQQDEPVKIHVNNKDSTYIGVPLKFWATFKEPVKDRSRINWERGYGSILRHAAPTDADSGLSDTVYLEWRTPPKQKASGSNNILRYVDSVSVQVDNEQSEKVAVYIENIFPTLDSLVVNGLGRVPTKDSLFFAVHRGGPIHASFHFTDLLLETNLDIIWPSFITSAKKDYNSDLKELIYDFPEAPSGVYDRVGPISISDGSGASREWVLRFRTFKETGSLWIGAQGEVIKLSEEGFEVYRAKNDFGDGVLMGLNNNFLYLVDGALKRIKKVRTIDYEQDSDFRLSTFNPVHAFEVSSQFIWDAQQDLSIRNSTKIRRYSLNTGNILSDSLPLVAGRVMSMRANTNLNGGLWFVNSEQNKLFLVREGKIDMEIDLDLESPKLLAYDAEKELCWVANENIILMINKNGSQVGKITGFGNVSSLSAGQGVCWVADSYENIVYKFNHSITKERSSEELTSTEFKKDYEHPVAVSMVFGDVPSCWVADDGIGTVMLINDKGEETSRFTGMTAPRQISINKGE
ncbi:MAG: hypothetical protein HQK83_10030 [Fibrobacteria bacterium]|nr:hypothetical protein [Fibrobacteria bacterium]